MRSRFPGQPLVQYVKQIMWTVWYWSCVKWSSDEIGTHYNNVIKSATSSNGIDWTANTTCIQPQSDEYSIGRPWIIEEHGNYRMWYSIRSKSVPYRIGYAESCDGREWIRRDDGVGIQRSESEWDSEIVCYPCVVDAKGKRYMFYNGNRHGLTGFGCAVLESTD